MALYDEAGFGGLAQRFGLRKDGPRSILPENTPAIGRDYLNSDAGAGGAYALFSGLADVGKKRGLANAFTQNYANYKAAVAVKPTLTYTDFLAEVDPEKVYHGLDWFNRGERPSAYQGRYKFIGGG